MAKYHFKIKNNQGEIEEGEAVAEDRFSLSNDMRNIGNTVISIEEIKERKSLFKKGGSIGASL